MSAVEPGREAREALPAGRLWLLLGALLVPLAGLGLLIAAPELDFPSRSLWDRRLRVDTSHRDVEPHIYDSNEFPGELLRIAELDVGTGTARIPVVTPVLSAFGGGVDITVTSTARSEILP